MGTPRAATKNEATRAGILPSWREGAARRRLMEFVQRVTTEGSPDYVRPAERVAVFDNDGTLWTEKPVPNQVGFLMERLAAAAERDPSLRERQPWKSAYTKDYAWLDQVIVKHYRGDDNDLKLVAGGILKSLAGMTVEEYDAAADAYLRQSEHPTLKRPYTQIGFRPMRQLLDYLAAHGFSNYIASGGDRDFMRPVTMEMYGIPREHVVGSTQALTYQEDERGGNVVLKAAPDIFDDGPMKPVRIWSRIGRRPLIVGGNANGDLAMMRFAEREGRPSLPLLILHDDAERETAYEAGAEQVIATARERGWLVVSMKDDWVTVF
jgi:phosphoglycolate phosphatase-like HAD superfamily hydrolase